MKELHIVEGFDVGCEMSGNGAALNQMLKLMRNGGKVALLGIAGPGTVIDWNDVIFKGLTLQGVYGRKMYETWYKMMAMVESGLDLSPVLTHRYHYTEFEEAFAVMNSGHQRQGGSGLDGGTRMKKQAYEIYQNTLDEIRAAGTYKEERVITTPQGARIDTTKTKGVLNMCANNYLGLADQPGAHRRGKEQL